VTRVFFVLVLPVIAMVLILRQARRYVAEAERENDVRPLPVTRRMLPGILFAAGVFWVIGSHDRRRSVALVETTLLVFIATVGYDLMQDLKRGRS
jgi:hypothetical protein